MTVGFGSHPRSGASTRVARALGLFVLVVSVIQCGRSEEAQQTPAGQAVSKALPTRPRVTTAPASSGQASKELEARSRLEPEQQAVFAWNRALNERDLTALEKIYGARVLFYGKRLARREVLEKKREALKAEPGYRQIMTNLSIVEGMGGFTAKFEKKSGAKLESSVRAKLVFSRTARGPELVMETDATTDAALRIPARLDCAGAALGAVSQHPEVVADRRRVAREYPDANPGGLIYEETPHSLDAAEGYMLPERFDPRWWVSVEGGKFSVRDAYTGKSLEFTPEVIARIETACSKAASLQ